MSKVLVDRELLELLRNFTFLHDDGCAGALRGNIDKTLAAQPAEDEGVDLQRLAAEFDAAPDDAEWEPPHPIFQMARDLDRVTVALSAVTAERDRLLEEVTELDALRDKLSGLLSKTAVALRGPEPELTRYGYADIPLRVKTVIDEREQLIDGMNRIMRATRLGDDAFAIACEVVGEMNGAAMAAKEAEPEHVCSGCGAKGWTGNCLECIPY